jgi:hypothetical protein
MRSKVVLTAGLVLLGGRLAMAQGAFERMLAKLSPEERSNQACILRGLDAVRSDPRLRAADRMQASTFSPAALQGTRLTATGGAVRAGNTWYALSFTCHLTGDLMRATSFSFTVGKEVPKASWDRLGLWQ